MTTASPTPMTPEPAAERDDVVLSVRGLRTTFATRRGLVRAVDDVSFDLRRGQTLGIVGESGSGKSVTALSLMRLVPPPGRVEAGQVVLEGLDLLTLSEREMERVRGKRLALVLQDPMTSLNPVLSVGEQIVETIKAHDAAPGTNYRDKAIGLLRRVSIPAPESRFDAYPHQLSGGMRQRVAGAIAIACNPTVLIADEPTTALDATTQLQYLEMLRALQRASALSVVFITHDFGIVATMCDVVAVMYAGHIVEFADVRTIFRAPEHPYTKALLKAVPGLNVEVDRLETIPGQPPSLDSLPPGCPFAPRCPLVHDRCREAYPPAVAVGDGHVATCWAVS
jgi:oligopeptide/dipeptide ABC transporter ATP-binding protein